MCERGLFHCSDGGSKVKILSAILTVLAMASSLYAGDDPCTFRSPNHISPEYLLQHVEETSRDFYYIQLSDSPDELNICGFVGGEHETHYRILGFASEHFAIASESLDGVADSSISGRGVRVVGSDSGGYRDVLVTSGDSAWVDIAVSAAFDSFTSGYRITISKD